MKSWWSIEGWGRLCLFWHNMLAAYYPQGWCSHPDGRPWCKLDFNHKYVTQNVSQGIPGVMFSSRRSSLWGRIWSKHRPAESLSPHNIAYKNCRLYLANRWSIKLQTIWYPLSDHSSLNLRSLACSSSGGFALQRPFHAMWSRSRRNPTMTGNGSKHRNSNLYVNERASCRRLWCLPDGPINSWLRTGATVWELPIQIQKKKSIAPSASSMINFQHHSNFEFNL